MIIGKQIGQWLGDAWTITVLCFRLLVSKKWIWVFFAAAGLLYALLLSGLTEAAEEESRIPLAVVQKAERTEKEKVAEKAGTVEKVSGTESKEGIPIEKVTIEEVRQDKKTESGNGKLTEEGEAEWFLNYLKELPVLQVQEAAEAEGLKMLRQGEVAAVLVIEEGYGAWLQGTRTVGDGAGAFSAGKPLTLYYPEGQEERKILAELIAGGVLERYCFYRSYRRYQQQEELPSVSLEEYQEAAAQYQEEADAGTFLEIRYEKPSGQSDFQAADIGSSDMVSSNTALPNTIPSDTRQSDQGIPGREAIYLQVVLGMLAGILLLLAFLLYAGGGEPGTPERSGVGLIGRGAAAAGNFLYVLLLELTAGSLLVAVFFWRAGRYRAGGRIGLSGIMPAALGGLFLFSLVVSLFFLLLREGAGVRERFLPVGMGAFALFTGLALVRVAASFLPGWLELAVRCSPGGWLADRLLSLLY